MLYFRFEQNRFKKYYSLLPKPHHAIIHQLKTKFSVKIWFLRHFFSQTGNCVYGKFDFSYFLITFYICIYTSLYRYACTVSLEDHDAPQYQKKNSSSVYLLLMYRNMQQNRCHYFFFSTCYNNKTFLSKLSLCVKTYDCILLTWWCWWNRTCTMNILGVKDQRLSGW